MSKCPNTPTQIPPQPTTTQHQRPSSFRIFTSNVRGLIKNWNKLQQIDITKYDILIFNEIWQIRDFENASITGFKIANVYQREQQRGGGVIIYIKEGYIAEKLDSPVINGVIETAAININNIIITAVYRPPGGNKIEFTESLTNWISQQLNKDIFISGDFNLNYKGNDKTYFDQIESSTGLKASITDVTRIESNSCIDNVLTNLTGSNVVSSICIADHQGLISTLNRNTERVNNEYTYREMKEKNWINFSNEITKVTIRGTSINEKWSFLCTDIKSIIERVFPLKTSKKEYKFTMSQGLTKSKNKKNKLLKQYKRGLIEKERYIEYNKIYRKLIAKEQENSFREKMTQCGTDSKKKWKVLKEELKIHKTNEQIESIVVNNERVEGIDRISKAFKDHFETCAAKLANEVPNSGENEILTNQQEEWTFHEITEKQLTEIIDSMKPKASCGFDLLSNRMLKKEKKIFTKLLITLINDTLKGNIFPDVLKTAKVIPIFKKGDKTNLNNYRPISLLPIFSKVLEKAINLQITKKLDDLHIIDDDQYGFRTAHSTEDAVIKFIDYIEKAKKENKHVISIHIDVSKAFDSCNHEILKNKLHRIGLSGPSLELMASYMKDRIQELWIDNSCGGRFVINIGVGQGTVLGPTLFKIYIMDMYLSTGLFSLRFADDSNLIGKGNDRETTESYINSELHKLHQWFCRNKLTLHPDKSRYIIHTKDKLITIKLGGKKLMRCGYGLQEESVKFLGINIDENLDWIIHTKQIKKKIGKGNYLLWRYRNKLTDKMKETIYECFIRTHITYCISVWGAKKTNSLTDLKKLIKKSLTKIGKRKQHTNDRLKKHGILKIEDELKIAESKIIWRWEKGKIPLGLINIIEERTGNNLRNRQFSRNIRWDQNSIAYRLATRAKNEIQDIALARSKKGLAKKLKNKYLLTDYNTACRIRNCFICTEQ